MGNHPGYHDAIYQVMMRYPGIAVLHDVSLLSFYLHRASDHGYRSTFVREMGYVHGVKGTSQAHRILAGLSGASESSLPLFKRIADTSLGIIVHSKHARHTILSAAPEAPVINIPLACSLPDAAPAPIRPSMLHEFPPQTVVIGSFGYLAESKRISVILRALAEMRHTVPEFVFVLVGQPVPGFDIWPLVREVGLQDIVRHTGFVDDTAFRAYAHWVDIGVNLRTGPTYGEMSATLLRLMAYGRPVLVSDVGGFSEMPDEAVLKIGQGDDEQAQLVAALRHLISNAEARTELGCEARSHVVSHHSFPTVAARYAGFIEGCLARILR
jgi:glycosyltransferase involved in cell wall biosynthesis